MSHHLHSDREIDELVDTFFPHTVSGIHGDADHYTAVHGWLRDIVGADAVFKPRGRVPKHLVDFYCMDKQGLWTIWRRVFRFKNENDAILFKLRWGSRV